jgi:hypothetical protein
MQRLAITDKFKIFLKQYLSTHIDTGKQTNEELRQLPINRMYHLLPTVLKEIN